MRKAILTVAALSLMVGGYFSSANAADTYNGTVYVAAMGGHFAVADITIDPSNTSDPIKVNSLDMMDIGGETHPTHDGRIDVNDNNVMYWSTYKPDTWKMGENHPRGQLHIGKSDLKTGDVIVDKAVDIPERGKILVANYCGSGQSADYYLPVSMADEGYISVVDKNTMEVKHQVFLDDLGIKAGEITFAHGTNTPDMKKFLLTVNLTPTGFTKWTGNTKLYMLDMDALLNGHLKKLAEGVITGTPGKTITFRQFFSKDGKLLFQSGADRGYMIDADTLKVIDEITPLPGENHDIMPTPDGKYAIMTLRQPAKDANGKDSTDGTLLLYDVANKKTVGNSASVCFPCHMKEGVGAAILCGIEGNWKM